MTSSGPGRVTKPANIAATFFRSSSASSYWSSSHSRTIAGATHGTPRIWPSAIGWNTWQDLLGRHPHQLARAALADIARMGAMEVVGDPPPDPVELDAEDDLVAVGQRLAFAERQVLGGEHLQLQRHREPVVRSARPEPEEALAGLEHGARGHGLEAVEVGQAIGIGLVGPGEPEALDLVLERAVLDQARTA